ncbi:2 beta-glucans in both donor and acceptor sites of Gh16 Laminarinase 16a [Phellopilus nigrolimitatus]|nr:2 beta-glucans in both donor and acceptor sites of Gh16 Laminarinase 16a [Phellopilus nigrolimitatus]
MIALTTRTVLAVVLQILLFVPAGFCQFNLQDNFVGKSFLSGWNWETMNDPTHGRVNYVSQATALQKNLTYASDDTFVMKADSSSQVAASARGRNSVRITSKNKYTDSVVVLDVAHMPEGCGTWPAFWTVTAAGPWPQGGEIDILEGANTGTTNKATLHTTSGCTMPQSGQQTGTMSFFDCDSSSGSNTGCGTTFKKANSYGAALNKVQGGWFVMKRTNEDGVYVYFWARNDPSVPAEVKSGAKTINPSFSWGEPEARFPTDSCNWAQHFDAHNIVFDLTLCGDWAGGTFASQGCSGSCDDFVNNNPSAFEDAYWAVNAVRVYTS